jgi:ATP-dependent exoDNAse (exonuclease V) alpha subunit
MDLDFLDKLGDDTQTQIVKNTNDINISDIEISDEYRMSIDVMENTNDNIFITGDAGTGKSTLLSYFKSITKKRCVVLAPTGTAAVNVGGQTIHSFFRFPPKPLTASNIPTIHEEYFKKVYYETDTIIIDEISMVRSDLMDAIDMFLQINLNSNEPFAGKQIIMFGDINQLPPVVATPAERQMIYLNYKSRFFFDAKVFNEIPFVISHLTKIYRQTDSKFIEFLNRIKKGTISQELLDKFSKATLNRFKEDDIDNNAIKLCNTNMNADLLNKKMLNKLDGEIMEFKATINGNFNPKNVNVDEIIQLKKGCKIMMMNNDSEGRWYNGTICKFIDVTKHDGREAISIEIDGIEHLVLKKDYENNKYRYDKMTNDIVSESKGTFTQYPIRLAYAITQHKSQGKTFDKVIIDFESGAFEHGMAYVSLSRCKTIRGISLSRPIRKTDIIIDERVTEFLNNAKYIKNTDNGDF